MRVKERLKRYLAMLLAFTMIMSSSSMNVLAAGIVGGYTSKPEKTDKPETSMTEEIDGEGMGVRKNVVTFRTDDYSSVHIDGKATEEGIGYAEDGVISFAIATEDGYEVESVMVDESIPLTAQDDLYTIHNIQTDETTVDVTTKAVETESETGEEYTLSIRHLLVTDAGLYEKTEDIPLEEQDFIDGKYDVLQNEYKKEGIKLSTSSCEVTTEDFTDHKASVELEYELEDDYVVIADSVASTFAVYTGDLDTVTIVPAGQMIITVNFQNENGTIRQDAYTAGIEQIQGGSYVFEYEIPDVPDGYTIALDGEDENVELEGTTISAVFPSGTTSASVTIVYTPATVNYTVKSVFKGLDGQEDKTDENTLTGKVDDLTAAEADPDVAGFSPEPIEQQVIKADGSTVVTIEYLRNEYTVKYDTQGGSYIKAKNGKYEEEVDVYGKTGGCTKEEHTHTSVPQQKANKNKNKTIGCYTSQDTGLFVSSWSWVLTCTKEEHTHTAACAAVYSPQPTRQGYDFGGWFTDKACTTPAEEKITFDDATVEKLTDNIYTVYAKWIPKTVNYREVYMKQVWDNSTNSAYYAYVGSAEKQAKVGAKVTAGKASSAPNYCEFSNSTSATVKADGSTVVYTYYNLKQYQFVFDLNDKNATLTMDGKEYKDKEYTIKAVLGQDISAQWPTSDNVKTNYGVFKEWNPNNGTQDRWVTKRFEVSASMLPSTGNTINLTAVYADSLTRRDVEYWLQSEDGNSYKMNDTYSQTLYQNSNDTLYPKELYGFTYSYSDNSGNTYRFYYKRDQKSITYMYGSKELKKESQIYFGANINKAPYTDIADRTKCEITDSEYTFAGWYDNAELTGKPYQFTVMPGNDLVLYAKWQAPNKTVTLVYQDDVTNNEEITVTKGDIAVIPVPEREGYTFDGWYEKSDCSGDEFDVNAPVTSDVTLYAKWISNKNTTYVVKHIVGDDVVKEDTYTGRTDNTVVAKAIVLEDYNGYVADAYTKSIILDNVASNNVIEFRYSPQSAIKYKVQYVYEGKVIETEAEKQGATTLKIYPNSSIASDLNDDGYTINEKFINATMHAGENTVTFNLKLKSYTITYVLNGGTDPGNPATYTTKDLPITLKNPTRDGYEFAGWTTTNSYTGSHVPTNVTLDKGTKGNLTFTATWRPIISVESYNGVYDGEAHSVKVKGAPEGSTKWYSTDKVNWGTDITKVSYTDVVNGQKVYVKVTGDNIVESDVKEGTVTITKRPVTITAGSKSKEYDGTALTDGSWTVAEADETSGLVGEDSISSVTVTGSQLYVGSSDNVPSAAVFGSGKSSNYSINYVKGTLKVTDRTNKYEITLVANSNTGNTYDGTEKTAAGVVTDTFTVNSVVYTVSGYTTSNPAEKDAGTYANTISGTCKVSDASGNDVTDQFTVMTTDGSLEIGKKKVILTSANLTKEYDGIALVNGDTALAEESGWVDGEGATYTFTGSQTLVGEAANAFSYTLKEGTTAANYEITKTEGKLTVTNRDAKYEVTLEANSSTGNIYDGTEKSAIGVKTDQFTIDGVTYTVSGYTTSDPTEKNAGTYENRITGSYKVSDADNNDVTDQFAVKTTDGSLEIGKKAVTLKSADLSKEYDGTALVNGDTALAEESGWVDGEGATYTFTGSQTLVGEAANAFTYTLKAGTTAANYDISKTEGTLEVTNRTKKYEITLVANSNTGNIYDGTEKTAAGVVTDTFTVNGVTYTVSGYTTSNPAQKDAGTYANTISGTCKVSDASGNDVTDQFTVKTTDGSLEIGKKKVTLTSANLTKEYDGTALVNGETALATESGWVDGEGATYTFTGSQTLVGEAANAFGYTLKEGTNAANYEITKTEGKLTVTNRDAKYEVTLEANSSTDNTYDGIEKSATGVKTDQFKIGEVTYTVSGYTTSDPKQTNAGTYPNTITGTYVVTDASGNNVTDQFTVKTTDGSLVIAKRAVTLASADLTKEYDGTALVNGTTALATESGWVDGEGATYTFTGSQTLVGEAANAFSYTLKEGTNAANYEITKTEGKLTVTNRDAKYEVTLEANSSTDNTYDGTEKSATGVKTDQFTINGVTYTVSGYTTSDPKQTNAGTYPNTITGTYVVTDASGNNVTDQFTVKTTDGSLEIGKKAVTLKSADLSKEYDGTALVNGETALATESGWVDGEGATYTFTGSQTLVGEAANAFSYTLKEGTTAANYEITKTEGKLTVTNRDAKYEVTLEANSSTGNIYDGTEKSATGVKTDQFTIDGVTYTVSGYTTSDPTEKNAGTYENRITGSYKVSDADNNDVTDQFAVKTTDGSLEIGKKAVMLKSADLSKEYDGTALVNGETALATESGWVDGEGATYTFTGSQTLVGEAANAFSYTLKEGTTAANYEITKTEGKLTVTNRDAKYEVTLEANSSTGNIYDGTEKSAIGVKTDQFTIDGVTYTVSGYTTSDPTEKNAGTYENRITGSYKVSDADNNDVTDQFTVKTTDGSLVIAKRAVTLASADLTKEYDGTALVNGETALATESGWVDGEGATYTFTGSQTLVGEADNAFTYTLKEGTTAANYEITKTEGKLTVTNRDAKYEVTLEANSSTGNIYDGTEKSATGVKTDQFTIDGVTYTVSGYTTSDPTEKNAGTYENRITGSYKVSDADNNDVTDQFAVKTTDGSLEIGKKAVTLKSADLSKEYDGTALVNGETALATESGWVGEEGATYTFTGSQTLVGEAANAFTYTLKEGTTAANYEISKTEGTLKVTDRTNKYEITLVANSNTGNTYDGTEKTAAGVVTDTFTVNSVVYTVSGYTTSNPAEKDAGTYANTISGTCKVSDASGNDVTDQFAVNTKDGELKIAQRPITITADDKTADYTGSFIGADQDAFTVKVGDADSGLVAGHTVNVKSISGQQMYVGEYIDELKLEDVTITAESIAKKSMARRAKESGNDVTANYAITLTAGKLTINGNPVKPEKTTPDVQSNYNLGADIPFTITVKNITNAELTNILVEDQNAILKAGDGYEVTDDHTATIASLASGDTVNVSAMHKVTSDDIKNGTVGNTATVKVGDKSFEVNADTDKVEELNTTLEVKKTSDVEENAMVSLNQTITYTITVANKGNVPYKNVVISDEMKDLTITNATMGTIDGQTVTIEELPVGETATITATHVVTEADILAGKVVNAVTAKGDEIPDPKDPDQPKTPEGGDTKEDPTEDVNPKLDVVKTSDVAEGETAALGQTITYTIAVTNAGNVAYSNVVVTEQEGMTITEGEGYTVNEDGTATITALPVGATVNVTATHVVTEADVLAGKVVNAVTAKGDEIPDPKDPEDPKTPEGGDEKEDPTDKKSSVLSISKEITNADAQIDGKYLIGSTVQYNITIKNSGNMTLTNITVNDVLTASEGAPAGIVVLTAGEGYTVTGTMITIASLAPNAQIVVPAAYVVTEADGGKTLTNVATGTATTPDPEVTTPVTDSSDPVPAVIEDVPDAGYLYAGKITVNKSVTKAGKAAKVNDTIYVALFDADGNMVKDTQPQAISLANSANGTTTFVNLPVDNATYKIVEVNESGEPVKANTDDFDYSKILYSGQTVTLTESDTSATASIENQIGENGSKKETSDDNDSNKSSDSSKASATSGKAAKTGDDTNMMLYWMIMLMAIAAMGGTVVYRRRRRM